MKFLLEYIGQDSRDRKLNEITNEIVELKVIN